MESKRQIGGRVFVIQFTGDVMGYMTGRTIKGTATRYAKDAGLSPDDSDLKVTPIEDVNAQVRAAALSIGRIKVIK